MDRHVKDLPEPQLNGEAAAMNTTEEGGASSAPTTGKEEERALSSSSSPPPAAPARAIASRPAASQPPTLVQAEEGHAPSLKEIVEEQRKAKAKRHLELGGVVAVIGFAVLAGLFFVPEEAKRPNSVRFPLSLLLAFATFISGQVVVVLNMLGLPENLVSRCLIVACTVLPVMTVVSLLTLLPSMLYLCIGLAVITVLVLPVVAAYCYMWRYAKGGDEAAAYEEHKEELEAGAKITWSVTASAFGGLIGVLFSASKSTQGFGATAAVYAAIFFMFSTAVLGMLVMTVSSKVPMVNKRPHRRFLLSAISIANAFLLCSLACAAFAASFAVIGCLFFVSFAPLAITAAIYVPIRRFAVRRGRGRGRGHAGPRNQKSEEVQVKATEDIASKVAAATMGAIMTVLAASVGGNRPEKTGATDLFMAVLTSTFVSSFGFMLLAAVPISARSCLAPISKLLVWSSVALFAAAAVSVYGVEVFRAASQ